MVETVIQSIASFVGTNIDDILILMILLASARPEDRIRVIAGQYIGVLMLLAMSIVLSRAASFILAGYSWVLGFIPLILGVRYVMRREESKETSLPIGVIPTALLTISNGADNLGVYIPLLSGYDAEDILTMTVVFVIMLAIWCMIALMISGRDMIGRLIRHYERAIVPALFIILGLAVIAEGIF